MAEAVGAPEKINPAATVTDESIFEHHTIAIDDVHLHHVIAGRGGPLDAWSRCGKIA